MFYIGCHKGTIDDGYITSSKVFNPEYNKRPDTFIREILGLYESYEDCRNIEIQLLIEVDAARNPLYYNRHNGGNKDWTRTGKKASVKHKHNMRRARIGKTHSEETKLKIGNTQKGKKLTEEHIRNIREAKRKKKQMVGIVTTPDDFLTIEEMKLEGLWPKPWTAINGLIPYIKRLGPDLVGLEVGVARAESSNVMLSECKNIIMLYGIDPYIPYEDWNGHVDKEINDKTYEIAIKNTEQFSDRFDLLKSKSSECNLYRQFDFIFIDGDHSYEGAKYDMEKFYPILKKGYIFSGHDYNLPSVRKALDDFREENRIRIPIQITTNSVWFWYK